MVRGVRGPIIPLVGSEIPAPRINLRATSAVREGRSTSNIQGAPVLGWALMFFILAVVAAIVGFSGIVGVAAGIAKFLLSIFLILLVVSFLARALGGRNPI